MGKAMGKTKKNIIYQTLYQILNLFMPFITAPYISRVLGKENTGIYSYTYTTVNYFMIFALLGIETYGTRTISRVRNDKAALNRTFSGIFYCHILVAGASLIAYLVYAMLFSGDFKVYALIQTLYVLAEFFNINWFFFGIEDFKITVTRNMIIKLLTISSIFLFVKKRDDLIIYITIMAVGTFLSQSLVWIFLKKYAWFVKVRFQEVISHLKPMSLLFVSVIATSIYRMISKSMLGAMGELGALGCFEYADKIIRMPLTIITAVGLVMLSKTSNMYANHDKGAVGLVGKSMEIVIIFASSIAFGLAGVAKDFSILFYGEEYAYTGELITAMSISLLFMSWNNILRTQYLMPKSKDKEYIIAVWMGAIVNVLSNIVLIHFFGATGAALSTSISYFVVSLAQTHFCKAELEIKEYLKKAVVPVLTGILMFVVLRIMDGFMPCSWVSLLIRIVIGAVIYLSVVLIYLVKADSYIMHALVYPLLSKLKPKKS